MELNKNYTIEEIKQLFGDDWFKKRTGPPKIYNKPVINTFDDFDEDTKNVYIGIYNLIKEKNLNTDIKVWATGSRIKGCWKNVEEAEAESIRYNTPVKYSDYDYRTNAMNKPTESEFFNKLRVKVDLAGELENKVLITI